MIAFDGNPQPYCILLSNENDYDNKRYHLIAAFDGNPYL